MKSKLRLIRKNRRLPKRVKTININGSTGLVLVQFVRTVRLRSCTIFRSTSHTSLAYQPAYRHFRRATASTRNIIDEVFLLLRITSLIPIVGLPFRNVLPSRGKQTTLAVKLCRASSLPLLVHCLAWHLSFADKLHYLG